MLLLPRHGLGVSNDGFEGVEQGSVPVIFENTPAPLDRVVLAVVRRIVSKANVDLMLLNELHHAVKELRSPPAVLGAVVLKDDERIDFWKPGLVLAPPVLRRVHDAIAGDLGRAHCDRQFIMPDEQDTYGRGRAVGLEVVIERSNRNATFAVARELADLDDCLGVAGNQQLVRGSCCFLADSLDLLEDGVGFGDFFLT